MPREGAPRTPLGLAIRRARKAAGFTAAKDIGARVGVGQAVFSTWETGAVYPGVDHH